MAQNMMTGPIPESVTALPLAMDSDFQITSGFAILGFNLLGAAIPPTPILTPLIQLSFDPSDSQFEICIDPGSVFSGPVQDLMVCAHLNTELC